MKLHMNKIILAILLVLNVNALQAADKPNVLIILADDLGYGDVQCNNPARGKIKTPNIDNLAAQGMRFTDAHSSSGVCSPSRYALLTGRYHWRTRLQSGIVGMWGEPLITADRVTIASLAKQHGYHTGAIGKWHLGWDWPIPVATAALFKEKPTADGKPSDAQRDIWQQVFSKTIPGGPTTRGFDSYFGTDVPNWPPYCFIDDNRTVGIPSEFLPLSMLKNHQASNQGPALKDWKLEPILPALTDRAVKFISDTTTKPEPFLLYMPLTTPHTPLAVNAQWKGKSGLDNACADLIMETDATVGLVLKALEQSGKANNTLVIFTSDNGFASYVGAKDLEQRGHFPSGPLRGYKTDVYEGGHRIPFIVRYPKVVKPGTVCNQLVHHADVIATLAEILNAKLPENSAEDSFSMMPLLMGVDKPIRENSVSCAASGIPGLRQGDWKLILAPDPKQNKDSKLDVQLYNLAEDIAETKNLAGEQPERVAQMKLLMEKLITDGRSSNGTKQKNDVVVTRYPKPTTALNKNEKATK